VRIATLANAAVGHTRRWVEHFRAHGHEVRVWSLPAWPLAGALRYPLAAPALARALGRFEPDLVDAHFVPNYGLLGALVGRHPLSVTAWGSDLLLAGRRDPLRRRRARFVLARADLVLADAANLGRAARELGARDDRVHVIPWGVDLARFRSADRREPGLLLSTRMHEPVYDLERTIAGLAPVMARRPHLHLVIAGDGSLRPALERLAARVLPAGRCRFTGLLEPPALASWLARAEIYLSASRSDSTSVSLLEAMASGALPVVSDIEGNREWVEEGDGARVFAPGDAAGLARALGGALDDPAWAERARARNRRVVEERVVRRARRRAAGRRRRRALSPRRVLIVCYFYPPLGGGGVHRVLGFTRHLPAHGWDCTVVCAGEEDYWVKDPSLADQVPVGTEVIRVTGGSALSALLRFRRGGAGGRRSGRAFAGLRALSDWWLLPDSYVGWSRRAGAAAAQRIASGGVDAVLTSSPPDSAHLAGLMLRRRMALPWVADFRDPWIGLRFRDPPTAWHRARQAAMERRVLEGADLVLAASRTHLDDLAREAQAPEGARGRLALRGLEHLPNGFEPGPGPAEPAPLDADHFTLVFTGTLSLMPDTEVMLEALHDLLARRPEARRRVRAKLAGPFDSGYADRAMALGLTGIVEFTGPVPHAATRALQRRAELLLLWKPRGAGYRTMVPGKLYEYLDTGRPVLALLESGDEAAELVRRAGGEVLSPGQREPLAAAIERHYLAWKEGARMPTARPEWLAAHTRASLAGRLAAQLDGLVAGRGGAA
jgi:glycosyltransferase involved in cell wall biosynthesis